MKQSYDKLNYRDEEDLSYLIHDKSHVLLTRKSRLEGLENAFKYYSELAPHLYRGLYKEEVQEIGNLQRGKTFSFGAYLSFSEKVTVGFSFGSETHHLLFLKKGMGFNYCKYSTSVLEELKQSNPKEYNAVDGDFLIKELESEKEWILPRETKFTITDFNSGLGFTVIECTSQILRR